MSYEEKLHDAMLKNLRRQSVNFELWEFINKDIALQCDFEWTPSFEEETILITNACKDAA